MRIGTNWIWFFAAAVISGCAPVAWEAGSYPPREMTYALDAVKLISPSITSDRDPSAMRQSEYTVAPDKRLLMRFQHMSEHVSLIRTDEDSKVQAQLTVIGDPVEAQAALRVCPLTRHFFMMATWRAAMSVGDGEWGKEGGDYDEVGCVDSAADKTDPKRLNFDVTQWFLDYPRARGANFGLILISSKPVRIAGDLSGSAYPRLTWVE